MGLRKRLVQYEIYLFCCYLLLRHYLMCAVVVSCVPISCNAHTLSDIM